MQSDTPSSPGIWAYASGPALAPKPGAGHRRRRPRPGAGRCRPGLVPPAVAPGRRRCSTPAAAAGQAVNTRLTNEQCAVPYHAVGKREVPRHARPRARRETEKKFAHGLLKGMQRA
jgi:hypothetical protein